MKLKEGNFFNVDDRLYQIINGEPQLIESQPGLLCGKLVPVSSLKAKPGVAVVIHGIVADSFSQPKNNMVNVTLFAQGIVNEPKHTVRLYANTLVEIDIPPLTVASQEVQS